MQKQREAIDEAKSEALSGAYGMVNANAKFARSNCEMGAKYSHYEVVLAACRMIQPDLMVQRGWFCHQKAAI